MSKITCLWDAKAELGEGVRYDAIRNEVWWVDILGQKNFCLSLNTGKKSQQLMKAGKDLQARKET